MPEGGRHSASPRTLAVVGMACRFPEAADPPDLLDAVLTGRRAFRRIPPVRLDLTDYYQADPAITDATYSTRAALLEGWQFDLAAFAITPEVYAAADPAQWLALETTARALDGIGFAGRAGLSRDRTGVIIGATLGDTAHAFALRSRWPYVRRVLTDALAGHMAASAVLSVVSEAERQYLAPFPAVGSQAQASGPAGIAAAVGNYFGFRGTGFAVESAGASSLQAVVTACTALAIGELDVAVAGGVDVSIDPEHLIRLAKAGLLARDDVRVYDENPTGLLPAEGCGIVVLMRTADARAAGIPIYAEIAGWGTSAGSSPDKDASSATLALQRAYERAGVDPGDVQLFEGAGASTRSSDEAELAALCALRPAPRQLAVLGSVTANVGHANAASGVAGLIKAIVSISAGVLPPATGVVSPHKLVSSGVAKLTLPDMAREWPAGIRLAGVSSLDADGANVHVVLRSEPTPRQRPERWRVRGVPMRSLDDEPVLPRLLIPSSEPLPFLFQAPDRSTLISVLSRIAAIGRWFSDSELADLACQLGRDPDLQLQRGKPAARVGLVAAGQDQLAARAAEAAGLLAGLTPGRLATRPGIFAADGADGRVALLLSGATSGDLDESDRADGPADIVSRCLAAMRWLESLDVTAVSAVAHGLGALAGFAWAGVLGERDIVEIAQLRGEFLANGGKDSGPAVAAAATSSGKATTRKPGRQAAPARHAADAKPARRSRKRAEKDDVRVALAQKFRFGPPRRELISAATGVSIESIDAAIDLICAGLGETGKLAEALELAAAGASLLLETGPSSELTAAAAAMTTVPALSLEAGPADYTASINAAAALFATGALGQPKPLFAGWSARPIAIWRERTFITNPCENRGPHEPVPVDRPDEPADASPHSLANVRPELERRPPDRAEGPVVPVSGPGRASAAGPGADAEDDLSPWTRCFAEELRPVEVGPQAEADPPWRLHVAGGKDIRIATARAFETSKAAPRTLAVVGDPADEDSLAVAAAAARDAVSTGELLVLTSGPGFTAFFASLQAEHPAIGVTVVRGAVAEAGVTTAGVTAAGQVGRTEPGTFRELVLSDDGVLFEPQMAEVSLAGGGAFPLGPDDVVLIGRGANGAGLALAQVLACCGSAVAVVGRGGPSDSTLMSGLDELRSSGVRIACEDVDLEDAAAMAAAVSRIESGLGRVTAVGHAVGPREPAVFDGLSDDEIRAGATADAAVLGKLVASVRRRQLRLIVTFGSVPSGSAAGASLLTLSSGVLAARAAQLARAAGRCRRLHVELPPWASAGVQVPAVARLLLKIMTTPGLPDRLTVRGRTGRPGEGEQTAIGPADLIAAGLPDGGRFLTDVTVYSRGIELICEPSLSLDTDPYLADYQVDGMPVLPGVLALEALAQAASVLAGRPLRHVGHARLESPVVVPPGGRADLRLCARREGDTITAVLRCADSSFAVDHARAEFSLEDDGADLPSQHAAAPAALSGLTTMASGVVDGSEFYGPIAFQTGRFRRIALLPEVTARSCRALARSADDQPWFDSASPFSPARFLLGSPGLNDAMLQALQACVPHRRMRLADCESVHFRDQAVVGPVDIRAMAEPVRPPASAPASDPSPPPDAQVRTAAAAATTVARNGLADGDGHSERAPVQVWNVEAVDAAGQLLAAWRGVRLRDCGSLPRSATWPPTLLSVFLERRVTELGLDDALRVTVSCGQPEALLAQAIQPEAILSEAIPAQAGPDGKPRTSRPARSTTRTATAHAAGPLAGFSIAVRSASPVACGWAAANQGHRQHQPPANLEIVYGRLRDDLSESPALLAARLDAVMACLRKSDLARLAVADTSGDGWAVLAVNNGDRVACVVADISGVSAPVAIAIRARPAAGSSRAAASAPAVPAGLTTAGGAAD